MAVVLPVIYGHDGGVTNYNTGDGTERHEELDAEGTIKGHYSYVDPNGKKVRVTYTAGKDGFKASGPHFASFNLGTHGGGDDGDDGGYEEEEEDEEPPTYYHQENPSYHPTERPKYHHPAPPPPPPKQQPTYHHNDAPTSYVHKEEEHEPHQPVQHEPEPVHYEPAHHEPAHREPVHREPVHHEPAHTYHHHQEKPQVTHHHGGTPVSHVNHVNLYPESHHYESEEEDDSEEEQEQATKATPVYKPAPTKYPTRKPFTYKPYTPKPQPEIHSHVEEEEPIKTKFSIKHPPAKLNLPELEDDEEYVAVQIPKQQHKFKPSSIDFPSVKTKTTYTIDELDGKPEQHHFGSGDHLTSFDTTKLLENYHNNKPSVSKLPSFPTTKFTIDDATGPVHSSFPSKSPKFPEFSKFKPSSPKFPTFKTEEHFDFKPSYSVEHKPSSPKFPDFKHEEHFDFKPSFKVEHKPSSSKFPIDLKPTYKVEYKPDPHFHFDAAPSKDLQKLLEEQEKGKDELFHAQLNSKNPASIGQYQMYLKSKEDEKIEQAFLREQLKHQQSGPKKRPSYGRPPPNKSHPGRRPPKRPSATPGLGSYRTTSYKIPYGFHFKV